MLVEQTRNGVNWKLKHARDDKITIPYGYKLKQATHRTTRTENSS